MTTCIFDTHAAQTAGLPECGHTGNCQNKGNTSVNKGYKVYVKVWGAFSWHDLGPLVESMPRRIEAVLAGHGSGPKLIDNPNHYDGRIEMYHRPCAWHVTKAS